MRSASGSVDALFYAADECKEDREIVMAAVSAKGNGRALRYTSRLRSDHEVVLAAVKQDGDALQFASRELKDDEAVAMVEVCQHPWALQYTSERARGLKKVVLAAVKREGNALRCAADSSSQR